MSKRLKAIQKLYTETVSGNFSVDIDEDPIEIIRLGEKESKLVEHVVDKERYFWTFGKCQLEDKPAIRMIFAIREKNKKVYNVEKITSLIKDLEHLFVYLDVCKTENTDGFIYLDAIKIL